jgi:hypothetical protein
MKDLGIRFRQALADEQKHLDAVRRWLSMRTMSEARA